MHLKKWGFAILMTVAFGLTACSGDSSSPTSPGASSAEVNKEDNSSNQGNAAVSDGDNHPSQGIAISDDDDDSNGNQHAGPSQQGASVENENRTSSSDDQSGNASSTMDFSSGDYVCKVTRTSNSVKVEQRIEGVASYVSTVSGSTGRLGIESELWYASSENAQYECEESKEEAKGWNGSMTVTCTSNNIKISEYDEGSLNDHEEDFKELCEEGKERYNSGFYNQYM